MFRILEGVETLNFAYYLQGSSVTQVSVDLGADVAKAESYGSAYEGGWSGCNTYKNGASVFYLMVNRSQREVALDLKSDEGWEAIYRLVRDRGYDMILKNFRPGVTGKLGLGYEELKKLNPGIIYYSCMGYGSSGPKVRKPGQDFPMQGASGLVALVEPGDHPPVPTGTALVDQYGAILTVLGTTAAVYGCGKTGKRRCIGAGLLESALDLQIEPIGYYLNGGTLTPRANTDLSTRIHQSPYRICRTAGRRITLSLTSFENLEQVFTPSALEGFSTKNQVDDHIGFDRVVCRELLKRTTNEWELIFEELGVWYASVNEYESVIRDEQVVYNQYFMTMNHPVAGEVEVLGHTSRYDGRPVPLRRLLPKLSENTIEPLKEAGYSDSQVQEMMKQERAVSPEEKQDK